MKKDKSTCGTCGHAMFRYPERYKGDIYTKAFTVTKYKHLRKDHGEICTCNSPLFTKQIIVKKKNIKKIGKAAKKKLGSHYRNLGGIVAIM